MAKRLSVAILLAACAAALQAQPLPWDDSRLYERLGLTDQQVSSIQEIVAREDKVIRGAQAELNIYKAQLEKLLLDTDPDMAQVQKLLQATVDWKVKSEMAGIRRRVEIRKVVGERKWEQLLRASRTARARNPRTAEEGQAQRPADRPAGRPAGGPQPTAR